MNVLTMFGLGAIAGASEQMLLRSQPRRLFSAEVTGFELYNADSDTYLLEITEGDTVFLGDLGTNALNIRAVVSEQAGSVRFEYDSNENFRTENMAPYALCGDTNGDYNSCSQAVFAAGSHFVAATTFSNGGATGDIGTPKFVNFSVQNGSAPSPTDVPVTAPTEAPVLVPTEAPVKTQTDAPVPDSMEAPAPSPTAAPSRANTKSPVSDPTEAPAPAPTDSPVPDVTDAPVSAPTVVPTKTPTTCSPLDDVFSYVITSGLFEVQETVDTSCESAVEISMEIGQIGSLEESGPFLDFLQVYYQVDGGIEVIWLDIVGENFNPAPILVVPTGSELTLRTVGKTSCNCESYILSNFIVRPSTSFTLAPTKQPSSAAPTEPTPAAPTTTPVASTGPPTEAPVIATDSPTRAPTTCESLDNVYSYDISVNQFETTEVVDTSCHEDVLVSMEISHVGDMEESGSSVDVIQVYFQVDDNPEVIWLDIVGETYDPAPSLLVSTGSQLFLRTVGSTSCSCETYQISNFMVQTVVTGTNAPSPTPPTTMSPTQLPPTTATVQPSPMMPPSSASPVQMSDMVVISGELRKWHKITLTYDGPFATENDTLNPFLDYRMDVVFSNGAKSYTVPGYFAADGDAANTGATAGSKWRCHFAPDEVGVWTFTTSFVTGTNVAVSNAGGNPTSFNGDFGSFTVLNTNKSESGIDLRGKGRLRYVGLHHLQFAESNEYFLKCGADSPENFLAYGDFDNTSNRKSWAPHIGDWVSGDPTWSDGKGKGIIGALNYLSSKGMNVFSFLTMNINGDDKNVFPYLNNADFLRIDVSKTAQWEIVFEHADKKGMFMHFKTQETENDDLLDGGNLGNERKLYYRELVARFGHHLALNWNLGEEITNTIPQIQQFSDYFKEIDPYDHPVVLHTGLGGYDAKYGPMLGYPTFDGASLQLPNADVFEETLKWVSLSALSSRKWIVSNDEQAPSSDGAIPDAVASNNQDSIRKDVLWGNIMAGGCGVEYYFGYSYECSDLSCEDYRSRDQMWTVSNYCLMFFKSYVPFWDMKNENDSLLFSGSSDWVLANGEVIVVYRKDASSTGSLDLSGFSGNFSINWYDPRNGGGLQQGNIVQITAGSNVSYGDPPNAPNEDWAILIEQQVP